jgi:tetratricopeptide (TPR) repeat protein
MMVIGSYLLRRRGQPASLIALAFLFLALHSVADDRIIKNDDSVITGRIVGVSKNQVMVEIRSSTGSVNKIPSYISDIKSVVMATPAEVTKVQAQGVPPGAVIAALEPQIRQFAGLPADWVVFAMAQLGDAYATVSRDDRALAAYDQITQFYPGSAYENLAKAGKAGVSLKAGMVAEALASLQPIIDQANQDIAPSPANGAIYAYAYMVYGRVLEAQQKPRQALEAYLTVKTMFYQNPVLVEQADQHATNLREHNPGLSIE